MKIILPLSKSPHASGRIGNKEMQDWYQGLVLAKSLLNRYQSDSKILVLTALQVKGEKSEQEMYLSTLFKLGIKKDDIIVVNMGIETIEQVEGAITIAQEHNAELVIISVFLHYPRVRWLSRGHKEIYHKIVWGIPRPREVVTDLILMFIFPAIDMLGLKMWFLKNLKERRSGGKF